MDRCGPCNFREEDAKAIKYCITCQEPHCKTCAEVHKSSKATRNHLQVEYDVVNKDSGINKDLMMFQRCNNHPEKLAEFFCINHKHQLCSTCMLNIKNLNCKEIVDIDIAGELIVKSNLNEQLKTDLENTIKHCKVENRKIQKIKESFKTERKEVKNSIDKLRQKALTAFDIHEKMLLEGVDADMKDQATSLDKINDTWTEALKIAEENKRILQIVTENGSKADIFRCALSIIKQSRKVKTKENALTIKLFTYSVQVSPEFAKLLDHVETSPVFKCKISTLTAVCNCKSNIKNFLEVVRQGFLEKNKKLPNDNTYSSEDVKVEVVDEKTFENSKNATADGSDHNTSAKTAKDSSIDKNESMIEVVPVAEVVIPTPDGCMPFVVDLVLLKDDCLVISEQIRFRLIRLNKDLSLKDATELSQKPGNMAVLNDTFVTVCLPAGNRIAFVSVKERIQWIRNIRTMFSPRGIQAVDSSRLLVSMVDANTNRWLLQVLTTDGVLLGNIGGSRSILDAERIHSLKSSVTSTRRYLQCCKKSNTLYCFEANGTEVFKYTVDSPNGLFVDSTGTIYLLGLYGKLHIFSHNGTLLRLVDIPSGASGIAYNRITETLYITRPVTPVISVFKLIR